MRSAIAELPRMATRSREHAARTGFLIAAAASFVLSVSLWFSGRELDGVFVGLWVPSILALGTLVMQGSRR